MTNWIEEVKKIITWDFDVNAGWFSGWFLNGWFSGKVLAWDEEGKKTAAWAEETKE